MNNEQVGISAEIAIADFFDIRISKSYRLRGIEAVSGVIKPTIQSVFKENNIPVPIRHIAERQNEIDFVLKGGKTLSVKTNKQSLGKVAPQKIGQASSKTWFEHLAAPLGIKNIPNDYDERRRIFKQTVFEKPNALLSEYWRNLFDCDYLIHFYNIVDKNDNPVNDVKYVVMKKTVCPIWDISKITFTKANISAWNESNTIKYDGVAIGEFQVHNHRDNFKFRFNMAGLLLVLHKSNEKN